MIQIQNLLFDIDTKVNRLSNLRGQFIPNETKIDLLNKAQVKLILKKVDINNNYQLGMDAFSKRYEDLQNFQISYEKQTVTSNNDILNSYSFPLSNLKYDMIVPTNTYVLATKGNCKDRILDVIDIMKHGDIRLLLKSPHYQPNFRYQETLGSISSNIFYVYGDAEKSFTITDVYISYLRYPRDMDIAGYIHLDGTPSSTIDCELEEYLEDELVDLVVEQLADATGNQEQSQLSRMRTKEIE